MRFKQQRRGSQIPNINLVPMLDVLMVVLTFFIIVSMTLTTQQGVEVQLPSQEESSPEAPPPIAIVKVNAQEQILFDGQPVAPTELTAQVKAYLEKNPKGFVVLQAEEQMPYEKVVSLLGEMKAVGGERVSLGIE